MCLVNHFDPRSAMYIEYLFIFDYFTGLNLSVMIVMRSTAVAASCLMPLKENVSTLNIYSIYLKNAYEDQIKQLVSTLHNGDLRYS